MNFTAHASQLALACNYLKKQLQVHFDFMLANRLHLDTVSVVCNKY